MKKERLLWLVIIQCFVIRTHVQAAKDGPLSNILITDFRSPVSLTETLQEGLSEILYSLDKASDDFLLRLEERLVDLNTSFDELSCTTRYNQILRIDKESLQKMISKIDQLIEELEQGQTKTLKASQVDLIEKVRSLSNNLSEKLS